MAKGKHSKSGGFERAMMPVSIIVWIACVATGVLAVHKILQLNLLNYEMSIIVCTAYGAALGFLCWFIMRKKARAPGRLVVSIILALLIAVNLVAANYSVATTEFLEEQYDDGSAQSLIEYSIIAQKDDAVTLPAISTLNMGIESKDKYGDKVKEKVREMTPVYFTNIDGTGEIIESNAEGQVDAAVLRSVLLDGVRESMTEEFEKIEVIATFTIEGVAEEVIVAPEYEEGDSFIVYISGIDTYGNISAVGRSDVNILAVFDPDKGRILLVNTPRDYYVQLHDTTGIRDKLTHAGTYGIEMSVKTLEDFYDIDIGYYVRVNFDSVEKIVDVLGGIKVDSPVSFTSRDGYHYDKGTNSLNGKEALSFARERKALADGDNERGRNQQRVITAIIKKMTSAKVIAGYPDILKSVSGSFSSNMPPDTITSLLAEQLSSGTKWKTESISVTGEGAREPTYTMGSQKLYVMIPDMESVEEAKAKIAEYLDG
jgi:LCP family protein required for cell wall assembly